MVYRKQKKHDEKLLTEVELEVMNAVWDLGECTVRDVHGALPPGRELAYTSVATMMKILEQKEALGSRKSDRAHTYFAKLTRTDYEAKSLRHLTKNVFRNDPSSMVMRLLDTSDLSDEALEQIKKLLEERLHSS